MWYRIGGAASPKIFFFVNLWIKYQLLLYTIAQLYNLMNRIIAVFKNKFFIAFAAFTVWLCFFDKNDIPSQVSRRQELGTLNTKIKYYKEQIEATNKELNNLQSNQAAIEKYAREKYFMKKDNEDVFIIE
jgi:cell division protein FtsB